MEVYKIVFTGGPCAGKTKTIDFVKCELEKEVCCEVCSKNNIYIIVLFNCCWM